MPIVYRRPTQTIDPLYSESEPSSLQWDQVTDRYAALCGNSDGNANDEMTFSSLAEMLSRRVCSRYNKNVIFAMFGEPGSGKSMAALSLAESCAKWIARFRGGKPEDYFTLDNVAVIHPIMLQDMVKRMQSHNIYILDDAGAAYDARNYMKQDNKALGYVLQTFRTLNSILIVTGVDGAMLDVNLHRTARYYAEVSESHHDLGYTDVKVFRALRKYRQKTVHYRYLNQNMTQIIRYRAYLPSKDLIEPYEALRKEQALLIQTMEDQAEKKKQEDLKKQQEAREQEKIRKQEELMEKEEQRRQEKIRKQEELKETVKKKKEQKKREGVLLTCQVCGYSWHYKGNRRKYATCPDCTNNVPIEGRPNTDRTIDTQPLPTTTEVPYSC